MGHHESDVLLCMEKDMERKKDILTDHRFLYMTEFLQRHLREGLQGLLDMCRHENTVQRLLYGIFHTSLT